MFCVFLDSKNAVALNPSRRPKVGSVFTPPRLPRNVADARSGVRHQLSGARSRGMSRDGASWVGIGKFWVRVAAKYTPPAPPSHQHRPLTCTAMNRVTIAIPRHLIACPTGLGTQLNTSTRWSPPNTHHLLTPPPAFRDVPNRTRPRLHAQMGR